MCRRAGCGTMDTVSERKEDMTQQQPKRILCIHDLSGAGRSSLCAILPALAVMGHQPVPLPTALLSTHTGGLGRPAVLNTDDYTPRALEHYHSLGLEFDCIYTGYLSGEEQLALVRRAFELWPKALKVTDPVMGDGGRLYSGLSRELCQGMRELCGRADLITPNLTEACYLLGRPLPEQLSREQALGLAEELAGLYGQVVVTGLPLGQDLANAGARRGEKGFLAERTRLDTNFPGTGDLFAAVLVGELLRGGSLEQAAELAAGFVADCIAATPKTADTRLGVWLEPHLGRLAPGDR